MSIAASFLRDETRSTHNHCPPSSTGRPNSTGRHSTDPTPRRMEAFNVLGVEGRVAEAQTVAEWSKEGLRDVYEAEILDWTDNYDENLAGDAASQLSVSARQQIGFLWLSYAKMEQTAFKAGAEAIENDDRSEHVLEKALGDPIGSQCLDIHLAAIQRIDTSSSSSSSSSGSRRQKQRDLFLGAVAPAPAGRLSEADRDKAWIHFLEWTRIHGDGDGEGDGDGNAALTLEELKSRVAGEDNGASTTTATNEGDMDVTPPSSDDEGDDVPSPATNQQQSHAAIVSSESKTSDDTNVADPDDMEEDQDVTYATITPELLIKRHNKRPALLFSAAHKEPLLSAVSALKPEDIRLLENYIGCPLMQVRERATWLLDVLEGLWTAQALKERSFNTWFSELRALHSREEAELTLRLDTAARNNTSNKAQRDADMKRLQKKCLVQLEVLYAVINEAILAMLREQYEALCAAGFPTATMALFEKIEAGTIAASIASSAGKQPAIVTGGSALANSSASTAEPPDAATRDAVQRLQNLVGALLNARLQASTTYDASVKKATAPDPSTLDPRKRKRPE